MKNLKKIAGILSLSLFANVYAASSNEVRFYVRDDITKLKFDYIGNEVTEGMSHSNELSVNTMTTDYLDLVLSADRKVSSPVATDFNNKLQNDVNVIKGLRATTNMPDKMNFYFWGTMYVNNHQLSSTAYIGQTHQDDHNNWWFGSLAEWSTDSWASSGKAVKFDSDKYLSIMSSDGQQYCISGNDISVSQFVISRCGDQNWVHFKLQDDVNTLSFSLNDGKDSIQVKDNIAYYPKLTMNSSSNGQMDILFNLERENAASEQIAQDFIGQVGNGAVSLGDDSTPEKLNFDLIGSLSINGSPVINQVYLAQATDSSWLLGNRASSYNGKTLQVTTEDGKHYCIGNYNDYGNFFYVSSCNDMASVDDNPIRFYTGKGVENISYEVTDTQSATSSTEQSLASNQFINDYLDLNYKAISAGSQDLLEDFKSTVYVSSQTYAINSESKTSPGVLNFILTGDLSINGSSVAYPVELAKEYEGDKHGIWLGSYNAWKDSNSDFLWVRTQDGNQYCISNGDGGQAKDYSFMISNECPESISEPVDNELDFVMGQGIDSVNFVPRTDEIEITQGQPYSEQLSDSIILYDPSSNENFLRMSLHAGRKDNPVQDTYIKSYYPYVSSLMAFNEDRMSQQLYHCYSYEYYAGYFKYSGYLTINDQTFKVSISEKHYKDSVNNLPAQNASCKSVEMYGNGHEYDDWSIQSEDNSSIYVPSQGLKLTNSHGSYCIRPIYLDDNHIEIDGFDHKLEVTKC